MQVLVVENAIISVGGNDLLKGEFDDDPMVTLSMLSPCVLYLPHYAGNYSFSDVRRNSVSCTGWRFARYFC